MTFIRNEVFVPPDECGTVIWRYMDFAKYVSFLQHRGLFFPRASHLQDLFEGSYPKATVSLRASDLGASGVALVASGAFLEDRAKFFQWIRHRVFINSWYMCDYESEAMWQLYANDRDAVCVKSTFGRLYKCIDQIDTDVYIGVVNYIDYDSDSVSEHNVLYPFAHKRRAFEHERELRAVIWEYGDWPLKNGKIDYEVIPESPGRWLGIPDLRLLVDEIYISPQSRHWFLDLVQNITKKYELDSPVRQSPLATTPRF